MKKLGPSKGVVLKFPAEAAQGPLDESKSLCDSSFFEQWEKNLPESRSTQDKKIYGDVRNCAEFFLDATKKEGLENLKWGKHFIILAYNLFELDERAKALDLLNYIPKTYYSEQLIEDTLEGFKSMQKAYSVARVNKHSANLENLQREGEFFLVVKKLIPFLESNENKKALVAGPQFQKFLQQFETHAFELLSMKLI